MPIRGVRFNNVDMEGALALCRGWLTGSPSGTPAKRSSPAVIHTPNAEIVQLCVEKPEMLTLINSADLIIPDGSGVILASKLLGTPLKKGKVAGVELSEHHNSAVRRTRAGAYTCSPESRESRNWRRQSCAPSTRD